MRSTPRASRPWEISPSTRPGAIQTTDEPNGPKLAQAVGHHGNQAYVILDDALVKRFSRGGEPLTLFPGIARAYFEDLKCRRREVIIQAPTLEELGTKLGIPQLPATVTRWNASVDAGQDEEFGREERGDGLRTWPFTAIGLLRSRAILFDGGLAVDERLQVLDVDGRPIRGLYAAGSAGQGGLLLLNNGLHIAWAHTSGRLAGISVASAR